MMSCFILIVITKQLYKLTKNEITIVIKLYHNKKITEYVYSHLRGSNRVAVIDRRVAF